MRQLTLPWKIPILATAVVAAVFHYYCAGFGSPEPRTFRGLHLSMLLPFVFLLYPAWNKSPQHRPSAPDLLAAALCLAASLYTVFYADRLNQRFVGFHAVRTEEVVLGGLLALAAIEACRRSISKWFALTVAVTLVYLMTCQYWPGMFHYKAFTLDRAWRSFTCRTTRACSASSWESPPRFSTSTSSSRRCCSRPGRATS